MSSTSDPPEPKTYINDALYLGLQEGSQVKTVIQRSDLPEAAMWPTRVRFRVRTMMLGLIFVVLRFWFPLHPPATK